MVGCTIGTMHSSPIPGATRHSIVLSEVKPCCLTRVCTPGRLVVGPLALCSSMSDFRKHSCSPGVKALAESHARYQSPCVLKSSQHR